MGAHAVTVVARSKRLLSRHLWSFPLALLSAVFFARLASEVREHRFLPFDSAVARVVQQARGRFDGVMLGFTWLGRGEVLLLLGTACSLILLTQKRTREVAFLATIGASALLLDLSLKLFFHRARPAAEQLYVILAPSSFSFPSGHALGSTAVLFALVVVARVEGARGARFVLLAVVAATSVLGVAASRVYFGVHFPSDVAAGICAGAALTSALTGWFYPRVLPGEETPAAE